MLLKKTVREDYSSPLPQTSSQGVLNKAETAMKKRATRCLHLTMLAALLWISTAVSQRNVVLILSDDHRYDFMGFHKNAPPYLETPALDKMAKEGAHVQNAFVTTSLCSPSRASILTGQYAHRHGIVDNTSPIPEGTRFFPEALQRNGFQTAYIGKWHMGEVDDTPMPGFDRWVSFRGQGGYEDPLLNIDGQRQQVKGYTTDILTDYAVQWLGDRSRDRKKFFMVLSHKAVHAEFVPAPRHQGRYENIAIDYPASMQNTENNYRGKPAWVKEQRNSWHGVDFMYHGQMEFDEFYRRYVETLLALDESVGKVLAALTDSGLDKNTLVIYMGDNGFLLGEHGLIDKRNAYEESIRVPMVVWSPGMVKPGTTIDGLVRNIDIAPTVLELTRATSSVRMDGSSFLQLLNDSAMNGGREFLYEYYWEPAFPHTPTSLALRTEQYKYIWYHGVWDFDELYDLKNDPAEMNNLARIPQFEQLREDMRKRLFDRLEAEGAMQIPVRRAGWQADQRGPRK